VGGTGWYSNLWIAANLLLAVEAAIRLTRVTAIPVIFDGKNFVPKQPVSLPPQSEAVVFVEESGRGARDDLDAAVRAYYGAGGDGEDESWGKAVAPKSASAWDED
jgi:hypothetical protein